MAPPRNHVRHEQTDVSGRLLGAVAAGLVGGVIAVALALRLIYATAVDDRRKGPAGPLPPEPRLQASPPEDMAAMRASEDRRLGSWGWADRQSGSVRMPIERAVGLVARRGLPGWPNP